MVVAAGSVGIDVVVGVGIGVGVVVAVIAADTAAVDDDIVGIVVAVAVAVAVAVDSLVVADTAAHEWTAGWRRCHYPCRYHCHCHRYYHRCHHRRQRSYYCPQPVAHRGVSDHHQSRGNTAVPVPAWYLQVWTADHPAPQRRAVKGRNGGRVGGMGRESRDPLGRLANPSSLLTVCSSGYV